MKQNILQNEKLDNKQIYINRQNLINNYDILKKAENSEIMSVIKGDAYGHGIQQCSDVLEKMVVITFM